MWNLYLIILLLSVGILPLMGQGRVRFAYDAAGNRVRRGLVVGSKKPKGLRTLSADSTQQTTSDLDPRDEADLGTFPQLSQTEGLYLDEALPRERTQLARGTSLGKRVAFSVSAIGLISKERFFELDH